MCSRRVFLQMAQKLAFKGIRIVMRSRPAARDTCIIMNDTPNFCLFHGLVYNSRVSIFLVK